MSDSISFGDALSWLDHHVNIEKNSHAEFPPPSLAKLKEALLSIGEPHATYPAIHITGTNGKGSTSKMVSALLIAHGLRVGTYTSPHLSKLNERIAVDLQSISDSDLVDELFTLKLLEEHNGIHLSWFEIMTAAAFSHFDTVGIDVAVVEVGMGGQWDATNVLDADVSVITNVSFDHVDVLGPELADIAREKAGIIKPESQVVLGAIQVDLREIFMDRPKAGVTILGDDLILWANSQAIGGRVISLRTKRASYDQIFLPLFGPHQGDNAALAICAVEEFFARSLDLDVVKAALERVRSPGRMEVVSRSPLIILDAAHNPAGMLSAKASILSDFSSIKKWHLVVSMLEGRDPRAMFLAINDDRVSTLSLARARSFRAMDVAVMGAGATAAEMEYQIFETVPGAISHAMENCKEDEGILVCGSIYSVAEAREGIIKGS